MDKSRPKKAANGKTYCSECGEQVVFMWKNKPNYCAICGVPLDWSGDEDPKAQLRAAIELADRQQSLMVKIETSTARKILEKLEKAEEKLSVLDGAEEAGEEGTV